VGPVRKLKRATPSAVSFETASGDWCEPHYDGSTSICGLRMSLNTFSQSISGLRSPPSAPHRGVAREEVRVVVDGREQQLAIVRQDRIHGQEAFWECPACGKLRWHLYLLGGQIGCRVCLGLDYPCRRTRNTAAIRAAKLRRRLGAPVGLLSPLPPRPRNVWVAAYYDWLVREIAAAEAVITARLRDMVGRRRKRA
jgi:hypothetical protein